MVGTVVRITLKAARERSRRTMEWIRETQGKLQFWIQGIDQLHELSCLPPSISSTY
jgi:hypothetical protein